MDILCAKCKEKIIFSKDINGKYVYLEKEKTEIVTSMGRVVIGNEFHICGEDKKTSAIAVLSSRK